MRFRTSFIFLVFILTAVHCYHPPSVRVIPNANQVQPRTLFIALDGVDYDLVKELHDEGHFQNFLAPIPFISTFPSDTTLGFTGILQPLNVGQVLGYEVRFYSYKDNKVVGGTPFDIYKFPIKYKYFFDSFRHQMHEKAIMYMFPGMAGKQDLVNAEKVLYETDKKILMTYLGGTDGFSHILGRGRTKKFLVFMDDFLKRMQERYENEKGEKLRIVLFSDHGFRHGRLKTVSLGEIKRKFREHNFRLTSHIESETDAVVVPFGLLSAGVMYAPKTHRTAMAHLLADVEGIDIVFWHNDSDKTIFMKNSAGLEARFEYDGLKRYRYIIGSGDPLGYASVLQNNGYHTDQWLSDATWKSLTAELHYPDVGFRLYDAIFNLVENPASILFSNKENYQFGSTAARIGTWAKFGHKGTHGGLFRETTWGVAMSNMPSEKKAPKTLRYDELFTYFLPEVTKGRKIKTTKKEVTVIFSEEQRLKIEK